MASAVPPGASATEIPTLRAEMPPDFSAEMALTLDAEGHASMAVTVSVPYRGIQWVRLGSPGDRYGSAVEITVSFEPRRAGQVAGSAWERRSVVPGFGATRTPRAALVERRKFNLAPGHYRATVRLRDLNAEIESRAIQTIEVPDYSHVPVGFADLELGVADSAGTFRPTVERVFGTEVRGLAARAALFDRRPGPWPRAYTFQYRVVGEDGEKLAEGTQQVSLAHSAEAVVLKPRSTDLFVGGYAFEVELSEGKSHWRVERSFEVEESGPPTGAEFDRMLEPLSYIAPAEEVDRLRNLKPEAQAAAWEAFWRRRDPTPETARNEALIEFIRRVRYTERHFQGYGPGWRSDMGRIYIRYGPPEQVESRPATTSTPQVEIWTYQNPFRRFVFADREGFGRYVLVSPLGE